MLIFSKDKNDSDDISYVTKGFEINPVLLNFYYRIIESFVLVYTNIKQHNCL